MSHLRSRCGLIIAVAAMLGLMVHGQDAHATGAARATGDAQVTGDVQTAEDTPSAADLLEVLEWRSIGPARGGRATTSTGVPGDPLTYYMGSTGGGVWKTENAGLSWQPLGDDTFKTGSVGAIAVAPSDHNVIYVGMGERDPRGNFSHGDGMYRSTDAGRSWKHIGLSDSRQVGKVRVHPTNPDLVYVAVLGHVFGPNEQRGVFRSTDGGDNWEKVLYVDENTGAVDLEMDPTNPRILYAGFWQVSRTPWRLDSGGGGSGIWKSTDGGDTWEKLSKGLPKGVKGKIGLAVSAVDSDRIYALVEAKEGGVYRSDDAGESWRRINTDPSLRQRAWYYTHIYADPQDVDTVYVLNVGFHKSTNGGRDFDQRIRVPHGDNHDMWINPANNNNMINANDGGANVSFDGGKSWTRQDMQPTAQFYHVTVDNQFPYRVYGAQQDNSTISVTSRGGFGGWQRDAYSVGGGESGYIAVRPDNPNIIYAGSYDGYMTRYDHSTRQTRNITVWPDNPMGAGVETMKYRFQWTFPIVISPHNPDTLYVGGNMLFKSTNEGQTWEAVSPDLTTDDKARQASSGGPITQDNTSVEYYCTIFTVAESIHEEGVIWTGSDDGLVYLTRDGGENWTDVTPAGLGEWSMISLIDLSAHDPATAYLAVNRYKMDDFKPYIFKTSDYGKTWKKITHGIADDAFVRAVREDPKRQGLLYAGTETGMWVSFDDGENWETLQLNLPVVPITDLVVHQDDVVVATQGRSFWILDDVTPLHQMTDEVLAADVHMYAPRLTHRGAGAVNVVFNVAEGLVEDEESEISLEFMDADGELIKRYRRKGSKKKKEPTEAEPASKEDAEPTEAETVETIEDQLRAWLGTRDESDEDDAEEAGAGAAEEEEDDSDDPFIGDLEVDPGINRFSWNMNYADATDVPGAVLWGFGTRGPQAAPGEYRVRLTVGDNVQEHTFEIAGDPRAETTPEEYNEQFDFLWQVRNRVDEAHKAVNRIRAIRAQVNAVVARTKDHEAHDDIGKAARGLNKAITSIEEAIIQTKSKSNQDPLNYPIRLNDKIAGLSGVARGNERPTDQAWDVFHELSGQLQIQLDRLAEVLKKGVPAFNQLIKEREIPAILLKDEG